MNRHQAIARGATLALILLINLTGCERGGSASGAADAASAAHLAGPTTSPAGSAASADDARAAQPTGSTIGDTTPVYRTLRDMVVACDNGRRCTVVSAAESVDATPTLTLSLRRDAGVAGAQQLSITSSDGPVTPEALRVDGSALPGVGALPWVRVDATSLTLDRPDAIARVIDLLRDGQILAIQGDLHDGAMSLSGFAAALLLVDDTQQRLGTRGAWLRRGTRADAEIPAAPPLPVPPSPPAAAPALSAADTARLVASVRRTQAAALRAADCDVERVAGDASAVDITRDDAAEPLDAARAVVFVTCLSGAYQSSSLVFIAPRDGRGAAVRVALPPLPFDDGSATGDAGRSGERFAMLTNAAYDPATGTLSHFGKGRGMADCGEAASWGYDRGGFRLLSFSQMTRCRGGDPGDWPTLWRTAGSDAAD